MALSSEQKALCAAWVSAPNRKWQTLNRSQYKYQFREKTLTRYVEEASMDESIVPLLLEYLVSEDCKQTLQLYGQDISSSWTPTRAWCEISNKSVGNVRAVRLYHAIAVEPTDGEDGPYVVEDGCVYRVKWTYYWKRESVPAAPPSTSGVSYRISGIQRDQDTGLFNYIVEERERVQQNIPLYLTRTTLFEDQSEEVHLGVRGAESEGGRQASVASGTITTRKVSKNPDCTHDVHNTVMTDKAVPESSVTVQVGIRGTTVTTVNRNMPAPASTNGLEVGESVQNQKTDSELWNQTIRRRLRDVLAWLRGSCRKTIFAHSHSETMNVVEDPGFTHVVEAAEGHIHEKSVHKTEDGYDVTDSVTDELPVRDASTSVHVGLNGTTRSVTHRNQPEPAPDPTEIGATVTNEKTQGGLWNQTIRERVRGALRRIADGCAKTIFAHRHSSTRLQSDDPGFSHVENAGDGKTRQANVVETEDGFRVDETETVELPVRNAVVSERMTLHGLVRQVVHRNQTEPPRAPTEIGKGVVSRRTDGGRYDVTETDEAAKPAGVIGGSCSRDFFTHHHSTTVNEAEPQEVETEFSEGAVVRRSTSKSGNGTSNNTTDVTTAVPQKNTYHYTRSDGSVIHIIKYRNQSEIPYYPPSSDGLRVDDSLNSFGLHDGNISYITNGVGSHVINDLAFIRHGAVVDVYEVRLNPYTRIWEHRVWQVQGHHICGDAYTDFLSDEEHANPTRTTPGVIAVEKIRTYRDRNGNSLAEWKRVELTGDISQQAWTPCSSQCKHPREVTTDAAELRRQMTAYLHNYGVQTGSGQTDSALRDVVAALERIPIALAAYQRGETPTELGQRLKERSEAV